MLQNRAVDALVSAPKNARRYWRQPKAARSFINGFHAVPLVLRADADHDARRVRALAEAIHDLLNDAQSRLTQRSSAPFTERIPS